MFKNVVNISFLMLAGTQLVSCIKDEALNTEADIESCTLNENLLIREPVITNSQINLYLKEGSDITALTPIFALTQGATVSPASGTTLNFTTPQYYKVTSQDRKWNKTYKITAIVGGIINTHYTFEDVKLDDNGHYHIFYERGPNDEELFSWSSGNGGFALTGSGSKPEDFPTYQSCNGREGKCLALTTRRTGYFGVMADKPLAAGNLFLGNFNVLAAFKDALSSTEFGMPFSYIPIKLKGYYKYTSGDTYYIFDGKAKGKLKPVEGKRDIFNLYAVLFESTPAMKTLNGNNVLSDDNPNIVSVARITNAHETDQWTEFCIDFVPRDGKTIDPQKLKQGNYSITVVFSSSTNGDLFEGAPGSTLLVDDVTLEYKETSEN